MECKGVASFLEELGERPIIEGHCDATATIAIASRLGLAKLKHIEIRHLWLQDEVREGRLVLHKIPSADNPADILTKIPDALDHVRIARLVGITLVWPLAKEAVSSNGDVQAVGRFLQLITLAACAYQGDTTDEGHAQGHLTQDMVVCILCTALPLILALLFLQRVGMVQIVHDDGEDDGRELPDGYENETPAGAPRRHLRGLEEDRQPVGHGHPESHASRRHADAQHPLRVCLGHPWPRRRP